MKRDIRLLAFGLAIIMSITACGKASGTGDQGSASGSEEEYSIDRSDAPFTITVTDKDIIYVEMKKSTFDPTASNSSFNAFFNDKDSEQVLSLNVSSGGSEDSKCYLSYGDPGDPSTTAVSDYGFEDLGDSAKYTIVLNNPDVHISGGDNLSIPLSLFESIITCTAPNASDEYIEYDADLIFIFDVDYAAIESRGNGLKELEEMLYQDDRDRQYLTPTSEDFRVDIFETTAIIFDSTRIDRAPASGLYVFGTNPEGTFTRKPVKVYRVYEFDHLGQLLCYKEKTVFENESDALHIAATLGVNGSHALWFIDWIGENKVPEDFTDEQGLKAICDKFLPEYYDEQGAESGYTSELKRYENVYYWSFILDDPGFRNKEFFTGRCETELIGESLNAEGIEFSADNVDEEGFIHLSSGDEKATVYYSKPEAHQHNMSTGSAGSGDLPDDFVVGPYDDKYFTPASDDYIIYYTMVEDYGEFRNNREAALISFDDDGNIIDAKFRFYRSANTVNPMEELIGYKLDYEGTKLLFNDDSYAYFDITDSSELKEYEGDGAYGDHYTKSELIEVSVDEDGLWMPMSGWSSDNGIYMSK
ncbi:MAG: hypothetical protein K6A69_07530 [Lachnospiraceae bacterium]|nr:hypothetical protein [Lachnospiraceae bacterium]